MTRSQALPALPEIALSRSSASRLLHARPESTAVASRTSTKLRPRRRPGGTGSSVPDNRLRCVSCRPSSSPPLTLTLTLARPSAAAETETETVTRSVSEEMSVSNGFADASGYVMSPESFARKTGLCIANAQSFVFVTKQLRWGSRSSAHPVCPYLPEPCSRLCSGNSRDQERLPSCPSTKKCVLKIALFRAG